MQERKPLPKTFRRSAGLEAETAYRRSAMASRSMGEGGVRHAKSDESPRKGSCAPGLGESRWLFFSGLEDAARTTPRGDIRKQWRLAGLQAEAQGNFAVLLAELCPKEAPPRRVLCKFDELTGRGPTAALAEFSSVSAARQALVTCRDVNFSAGSKPKWQHCSFARAPGVGDSVLP
mmetsp:Transcript_82751/g.146125  ORF Transcript_82751/g.146125 Transcript_82751/m.146125 type:complete len:176 (+) Transcript_82751:62-589(+)